ncbi:MAG: nitrilase-related carbon-nitrogen hydrolase [Bacillota bacterium]|nr:nitrilase-related carbon-nitrogen hydrolase [Bacillota bacterium]
MDVLVGAVQLEPRWCESVSEVADLLRGPVERAARAGARLVVLPYLGDLLARPHAGHSARAAGTPAPGAHDESVGAAGGAIRGAAVHGEAVGGEADDLVGVAGEVAREAGVYLALGLPDRGRVGVLLGPDGRVLGGQRQTHVLPEERTVGLVPGDELFVFPTEVGRFGMLVGSDAWYPEVSRILALQGAQVLLSLQAVRRPYVSWRQLAGIWQEVQQNQTLGVESCLHGRLALPCGEVEFEGRTAIFAPCEMTPGETGILNDGPDEEGLVLAHLDFAAREEVIRQYPVLGLLNPRLYRRYLPAVYRSAPAASSVPGTEGAPPLPPAETGGPRADAAVPAGGACAGAALRDARVTVAAVQMRLELVRSPEEYAGRILGFAARAAERGARLVAFPEDVATALLGLLPGIDDIMAAGDPGQAVRSMGPDATVADIFRSLAPVVQQVHEAAFSEAARRFGVYVVAGSAILPDARGRMVNVAHVYDPDGSRLGEQQKCHFIPMEVAWGLQTGDDLAIFGTPWGRFAAPVCMDATYFETFRILAQRGAEVVIIPSANPEQYNWWKALRGIWPRVQESQVYGIQSCMVGSLFGLTLTGRSGVLAPMELSATGDGVLAQTDDPHGEDVVVADLDLEGLRRLRDENGVHRAFNPSLYERYFPGIYGRD